jgi:hypothetical protein
MCPECRIHCARKDGSRSSGTARRLCTGHTRRLNNPQRVSEVANNPPLHRAPARRSQETTTRAPLGGGRLPVGTSLAIAVARLGNLWVPAESADHSLATPLPLAPAPRGCRTPAGGRTKRLRCCSSTDPRDAATRDSVMATRTVPGATKGRRPPGPRLSRTPRPRSW